jgi:hypothetical protein
MQSLDNLSEAAKIAHQAFLDMSNSKDMHFNFLKSLESKYESGGAPSIAENLELEKLLSIHDSNVAAFTAAMNAVTSEEEKKVLIQLIS